MSDHEDRAARLYVVGDYLMDRLAELGLQYVFGVPGDYSMSLLDSVVAHPDVDWVGCDGVLDQKNGLGSEGLAPIRPDGYLGLLANSADPAVVRGYLADILRIRQPSTV